MEKQIIRDLAEFISLENEELQVVFCNIGASIAQLKVRDKKGEFIDVVLGYQEAVDYDQFGTYFGAVCGRVANRINKGHFQLNDQNYQLDINNGDNHLHGGEGGISRQLFTYDLFENRIEFTTISPANTSGYPGELEVKVVYTLANKDLIIDYFAKSDEDTLVSLTNHSYFNLAGHNQGNILDHYLTINAEEFIPINQSSIPLGEKRQVANTCFDFRKAKKIGEDINKDDEQLIIARGYDHSFCVGDLAAILYCQESGICLEVISSMEGLQLYTGNWIENLPGKGCIYQKNSGVALESQYHPDAINQEGFKKPILRKGELYQHQTIFRFSIK